MGLAVVVAAFVLPDVARADDLYDRLWPQLPLGGGLTLSQQITDQLTELGNTLGTHLDLLSHGELGLQVDGRRRRARVRLGSTDTERYLVFRLASDIHFTQGVARVRARLDLGIGDHIVALELPDFEMAPTEYRGERGVVIRVPLFRREF
ncbi:MAG: hypothetical protein SFX73_15175 [Kofleriaceae bacterium]|nr:hypothetical protein [Kofleriaceae bacterium]